MTTDGRAALLRANGYDVRVDGLGNVFVNCAATGRQWRPVSDDLALELIGATKS